MPVAIDVDAGNSGCGHKPGGRKPRRRSATDQPSLVDAAAEGLGRAYSSSAGSSAGSSALAAVAVASSSADAWTGSSCGSAYSSASCAR